MPELNEIQIRDPFVLPVRDEGFYYLYGTTDANAWEGPGGGFDCYRSPNLLWWDGPFKAFRPPQGFWGTTNFWAPEVHARAGRFFMFASFYAPGVRRRGTQVLVANSPLGPFVPHSDGPVTPPEWECLDGTLYVDREKNPWMIFCHEWVQAKDGRVCAVRLSKDLSRAEGEPAVLFTASDAPWTAEIKPGSRVTDGPFVFKAYCGELLLLWASAGRNGYTQGVATSASGDILGPWVQEETPLFDGDGGHGMLFRTFEGELTLTLHCPNESPRERALFIPMREYDVRLYRCDR